MHCFAKLAVFGAVLLSLYATPSQAQADVQCSGTVNQTWKPGLQLLPRMVAYTNTSHYDQCNTSVPTLTSGSIHVSASFNNSCLANVGPSQATLQWNDGSASTFTFQGVGVNVVGNAQVFVSLGQVQSGRFAGDQVVLINSFLSTAFAACATPQGLTSLAGSTTLTFTRLL
ncbi:hypothetical protein [Corallococcus carmarthensis]|uniref:Uncharacterized protein n=1 Tax=Corallococcus carmarthensis TaxID=2316728 RepID=A0A3A8KGW6_9BACT|nr:hypothetical protein [Corallococcus carmarthensis]NOK16376.1 hypothetical protein [Corallococcus carmarthensis]RKH06339.1 hypothetical protein D7X32_05235 [Corallococcus carmarthensis]